MNSYRNIIRCFIAAFFFGTVMGFPAPVCSQTAAQPVVVDNKAVDSVVLAWLKSIYEEGVTISEDSLTINAETSRLLTDETYRKLLYPKTYSWEAAKYFIQGQDLKKAFWYLLNLYLVNEKNKEVVIKSLMLYDRLFKMDKILVNVFYTYVFTDPEIGTLAEGQSRVTAPHIMERKLNALKDILFYLEKYRPLTEKENLPKSNNR